MLRGKGAVIRVVAEDLVRRCACGWREKELRWIFAHGGLMIFKKPAALSLLKAALHNGYIYDLARPESLSQFSSQLLTSDLPINILILNAAQWLSGTLDDQPDTEIINTVSSSLTGPILLTKALLPGLRRSDRADVVSIISPCGPSGSEAEKCDINNNSLLSLNFSHISFETLNCSKMVYEWDGASESHVA